MITEKGFSDPYDDCGHEWLIIGMGFAIAVLVISLIVSVVEMRDARSERDYLVGVVERQLTIK